MSASKSIVLVTGGNNGIGLAACQLFASLPRYTCIMASRSLEKGQKALSSIKESYADSTISLVQLDITSDASIAAAVKEVESKHGHLDVLINNAGVCPTEFNRSVLREVIETNAISPAMVTQAFAPLLLKSSAPRTIYVSSALGSLTKMSDPKQKMYYQEYKAYNISKATLNMVVACESIEYADKMKVFAYCPGYVITDLAGQREEKTKAGRAKSPEGSARGLLAIADGKRDVESGKFLHDENVGELHPCLTRATVYSVVLGNAMTNSTYNHILNFLPSNSVDYEKSFEFVIYLFDMLHIRCSGSPFEIGQQHGRQASHQVHGSIAFYKEFLEKRTEKTWSELQAVAEKFVPMLQQSWPSYLEEIKGIAEGAGVDFQSVLVLNVRTEIAYGLQVDGCTAFSWKSDDRSFIAQNWDWNFKQTPNIISLHIKHSPKPDIHMVTEAGIIGKIGLNSAGVGVTLNAIAAKGVDYGKLPCHLALRTVLETSSEREAKQTILTSGVAAACHITIADAHSSGVGLECTSADIIELQADGGITAHSNHLIAQHIVEGGEMLKDSPFRLAKVQRLLKSVKAPPTVSKLLDLLKDEENYPDAICRASSEKSSLQTLFSIVMDLKEQHAIVKMGRPTEEGEVFELRP